MDPISNPTPTPSPAPTPAPNPEPTPAPVALEPPVAPAPGAPAGPEAPVNPVPPEPAAASNPVSPVNPVNPVVNPTGANPVFQPNGVAATDPIMMPEQPKAPDPIEEELKAPMKAAAPVPGSIGSAISGPEGAAATEAPTDNVFANNSQTPSVSFNDPATQPDGTKSAAPAGAKKTNKNTMIALIVVASMVVIALVAVLIFTFMGGDSGNNGSQGNNQNSSSNTNNGGSNNSNNSNGSNSSNSSNNSSNSGTNTNSNVSANVVCTTTSISADATAEAKFTYAIVGNKLASLTTTTTITETGGEPSVETSTLTYEEMKSEGDWTEDDAELIEEDGTLTVTPAEFAKAIENALNESEEIEAEGETNSVVLCEVES